MIRSAICGLALILGAPSDTSVQETAEIRTLIRKLGDADWMEQARAATALRRFGDKALGPLAGAQLESSPAIRYWAKTVTDAIKKGGAAPAPTPVTSTPVPAPAKKGAIDINANFNPSRQNQGVVVFICNNTSHGDYEVVIEYCPTCAKRKRFSVDHSTRKMRCAVCKVAFEDMRCDQCNQPKNPRRPAKMRPR